MAERRAGFNEVRHDARTSVMATGTLACPACDAPVAPGEGALSPADPIACPYCLTAGFVRDFLTLTDDPRPAKVRIRLVQRARAAR